MKANKIQIAKKGKDLSKEITVLKFNKRNKERNLMIRFRPRHGFLDQMLNPDNFKSCPSSLHDSQGE